MALTTDIDAVAMDDAATAAFVLEPSRHSGLDAISLAAGKYLIGSAGDCQIRLPAEGVQPHHALLIVGERKSLLKAWDEKTWINDWPVKESVLHPGDRLSIGPVTLVWRALQGGSLPAMPIPMPAFKTAMRRLDFSEAQVGQSQPAETNLPRVEHHQPAVAATTEHSVASIDQQRLSQQEQRLEELSRRLDARAEDLQREFDLQTGELREREREWFRGQQRAEQELAERERTLQTQWQEIEDREAGLAKQEIEWERREAEWAAYVAEIRSAWESTQRDGEQRIAERLDVLQSDSARLQADISVHAQRQQELERLQQAMTERESALANAIREFEQRQLQEQSDRETLDAGRAKHEQAVRELDEQRAKLAEERHSFACDLADFAVERAAFDQSRADYEQAVRECDAQRAKLTEEQHSFTSDLADLEVERAALDGSRADCEQSVREVDEQRAKLTEERHSFASELANFEANRTALDEQRRDLMGRVAEIDERQRQLDELQARLKEEQGDLIVVRREIQADRAALDDERTALAAEREAFHAAAAGNLSSASDDLRSERVRLLEEQESQAEQLRLFEQERSKFQAEIEAFQSRQREWQEAVEQHRLSSETRDRDLQDRQQALSETSARLLEDRREFELRRADLDAAELKLQESLAARDAELDEVMRKQERLDQLLEQMRVDQDELKTARQELDAAREAWKREADALRQELDARAEAHRITESNLADREAALNERLASLPAESPQPVSVSESSLQTEIERLTDELSRELEYRRTIESQLEGIRSRHERDAEQWNGERTDWMVERDRLERELQVARRQAATGRSKTHSSDPPSDHAFPQDAPGHLDPVDADDFRTVDSVSDDSKRLDVDNETFASHASELDAATNESADSADPLDQVRAELAKMFELSDRPVPREAERIVDPPEPPPEEPVRPSSPPVESAAPAATDWQSRLEALRRQAERESPSPPPPPVSRPETLNEPPAVTEEEDSIAAYMERMLARNRKGDEPRAEFESRPMPVANRPEAQSSPSSQQVSEEPREASAERADESARKRSSRPRVAPDKIAVREHLDVFREVANVSARTAVAKHTSRRLWMLVAAKSIVALVCSGAAAAFLYVSTVLQQGYHWQALFCGVLGLVVGVDLLRHLFRTRRTATRKPARSGSASAVEGESNPTEATIEACDEESAQPAEQNR